MKLAAHPNFSKKGYALVLVMFFASLSLLVLASALSSSSTSSRIIDRQRQFNRSVTAAEAATEKVIANILRDFHAGDHALVQSRLSTYRSLIPTPPENSAWAEFRFSDGAGQNDQTGVFATSAIVFTNLQSQYRGVSGYVANYEVISDSALIQNPDYATSLSQEFQLARIPLFQFGIFYGLDLEIHPSNDMPLSGRIHSNGQIFSQPSGGLTYLGDVTCSGYINHSKKSGDPVPRTTFGTISYRGQHDGGVGSMTLPVGTNQTPVSVHRILEVPPSIESRTSDIGLERFYNKADLIILVSNTTVVAKSGSYNNFSVNLPWSLIGEYEEPADPGGGGKKAKAKKKKGKKRPPPPPPTTDHPGIIATNYSFFNKRENKTIMLTELDVELLIVQYADLTTRLGRNPKTIYIGDFRTQTASSQSGLRVINADKLPTAGLTIATLNPLYILGDYNSPTNHFGTTNTTATAPASIVADAITLLSDDWDDANGGGALSIRKATNTTVNAAILTGIVPTSSGYYSGGVENLFRFLEDWTGDTFTFNGSIAVLFHSTVAVAPWGGFDVYVPPLRKWSLDQNFSKISKLPPATPQLRAIFRSKWEPLASNN